MEMTVQQAKLRFTPAVDGWVKAMRELGLRHAAFRIDSGGLHEQATTIEVGIHADLLAERGAELVSHSVIFFKDPAKPNEKARTVVSLLVRLKPEALAS